MVTVVHFNEQAQWGDTHVCTLKVGQSLASLGVTHGQFALQDDIGDSLSEALQAYGAALEPLKRRWPTAGVDRIQMRADDARWPNLHRQFLTEHTHSEAEIRFFLGGVGLFYLRTETGVLGVLCETGDWIAVPAGAPHWFDGGAQPDFDVLRLLGHPQGWVAQATGRPTPPLPSLEAFTEHLMGLHGFQQDDEDA